MYFEGMLEQQWAVAWPCGRWRQSDGALWMRCPGGRLWIHQISAPPSADGFRGQPAEEEPAPSDVAWLRSHH